MKKKKESFFWASYADLMTSLFFIMLLLFVLITAVLQNKLSEYSNYENEQEKLKSEIRELEKSKAATEKELDKIKEIELSTHNIDKKYFTYVPEYRKHILNIEVKFPKYSSSFDYIDYNTLINLEAAGQSIRKFIAENKKQGIQYLLIIEGQASRDNYHQNYELSYERGLALKKFWDKMNIVFGNNCEVLISGSGDGTRSGTSLMRDRLEEKNQRFLIHIVPKHGTLTNK